jgi:diadenylate cyclase
MSSLWGVIYSFRLRDAVDILLVAAVVYRVLIMFRGTRAVQMLAGLGGLMIASFLARRLDLFSTSWILENFWSVWVLALVVLFQPELRRARRRSGRTAAQSPVGPPGAAGHVIDDVVKAAESLAAKRMGALIVLERSTGLRNYAELGCPRRARLRRPPREPVPALLAAARRRGVHPR